jgi:excisionase family DNA binding protein
VVEYLSAREVARELKVDKSTVLRWISLGKLKAYRINRGALRISRADLDEMMSRSVRIANDKIRIPTALTICVHGLDGPCLECEGGV